MFMAFDLLHQDGVDLRALLLSERKRDLRQLCRKSRVPFMRQGKPHCFSITAASLVSRTSCPSALTLFERAEPQLGQDEVPGLDAHQLGAVSPV
jgi:ATP-dependent DNA ligase